MSGRAGAPGGRPAAARRRPAGWSPRARGAGRCRAGPARPRPGVRRGVPDLLGQRSRPSSSLPVRRADLRLSMLRRQYRYMDNSSGVGVLDKAAIVLGALEAGPASLAAARRRDRPGPAHRAPARRRAGAPPAGGPRPAGPVRARPPAARAGHRRRRGPAARGRGRPVLARLRDVTGESAQLYRRQGDSRVCVAARRAAERPARHRAGRRGPADDGRLGRADPARLGGAGPAAPRPARREVHRRPPSPRYAAAAGRRASASARPGVASVSAPIRGPGGRVIAAVSVSGPIERLSRHPGRLHAQIVCAAAAKLSEVLQHQHGQQAAGQPGQAGQAAQPGQQGVPSQQAGRPRPLASPPSQRPLWPRR